MQMGRQGFPGRGLHPAAPAAGACPGGRVTKGRGRYGGGRAEECQRSLARGLGAGRWRGGQGQDSAGPRRECAGGAIFKWGVISPEDARALLSCSARAMGVRPAAARLLQDRSVLISRRCYYCICVFFSFSHAPLLSVPRVSVICFVST